MRGYCLPEGSVTRSVALLLCLCWVSLGAIACDQRAPEADESAAASSEQGAEKATEGATSKTATEDFQPSVPAVWDSVDPKAELEGREALLDYLNDVRARHNLEPVTWDDTLEKAAVSHAEYIMKNKAAIEASGVSIHVQDPALPGYTGDNFVTRGRVFEYPGECFGEVVAFKPTAVGAARSWLESLYHRFPLLDADAVHIGYAELQLDEVKVNVMEVGRHD